MTSPYTPSLEPFAAVPAGNVEAARLMAVSGGELGVLIFLYRGATLPPAALACEGERYGH